MQIDGWRLGEHGWSRNRTWWLLDHDVIFLNWHELILYDGPFSCVTSIPIEGILKLLIIWTEGLSVLTTSLSHAKCNGSWLKSGIVNNERTTSMKGIRTLLFGEERCIFALVHFKAIDLWETMKCILCVQYPTKLFRHTVYLTSKSPKYHDALDLSYNQDNKSSITGPRALL